MCFAVPGKITAIKKGLATVEYGEVTREAQIIDDVYEVGDYVIVQAKFVIQKIPKKQALESLSMIKSN